MRKELRIDLEYLAKTYGIEYLESATVKKREGRYELTIEGSTK